MYKCVVIVLLLVVLVNAASKPKGPPPKDGVPPGFAKVLGGGKYKGKLVEIKNVYKEKISPKAKKAKIDKIMKGISKETLAKLPKPPKK